MAIIPTVTDVEKFEPMSRANLSHMHILVVALMDGK